MVTREQVAELHLLYEQRAELQRCREYASDRNFWVGIANTEFSGAGKIGSVILNAVGKSEFIPLMQKTFAEKFEAMQKELDTQIVDLGGQV